MGPDHRRQSSAKASERSAVATSRANMIEALEAYDEKGEVGLQDVLDRIYPGTSRPEVEDFFHRVRGVWIGAR